MKAARYYVYTYDIDLGKFTPQKGVSCGPYRLFALRKPLRALRAMSYGANRDDPSVFVTRTEKPGVCSVPGGDGP